MRFGRYLLINGNSWTDAFISRRRDVTLGGVDGVATITHSHTHTPTHTHTLADKRSNSKQQIQCYFKTVIIDAIVPPSSTTYDLIKIF